MPDAQYTGTDLAQNNRKQEMVGKYGRSQSNDTGSATQRWAKD